MNALRLVGRVFTQNGFDSLMPVWNHMLGLPKSELPPPEPYRSINYETGEILPPLT